MHLGLYIGDAITERICTAYVNFQVHFEISPAAEGGSACGRTAFGGCSAEELSRSNCTKADGRELLDPNRLLGIKCK